MQDTIYIQDELVLEAHLDADNSHILIRREGEPGAVRVYLGEVRYLISALGSMAAEMAEVIVGDDPGDTDGQDLVNQGTHWQQPDRTGKRGQASLQQPVKFSHFVMSKTADKIRSLIAVTKPMTLPESPATVRTT